MTLCRTCGKEQDGSYGRWGTYCNKSCQSTKPSREAAIIALLLEGCDTAEMCQRLNMKPRTVKGHLNKAYVKYGITSGIKRVKLAVIFYRKQLEEQDKKTLAVATGA